MPADRIRRGAQPGPGLVAFHKGRDSSMYPQRYADGSTKVYTPFGTEFR